MLETLLQTKLYVPPLRPNLVSRPQLIERLNQGLNLGHKLTLISAPAGYGKTTLVSEWVTSCKRPVAWLSLDKGDNDLTLFLAYLVASLQTVAANIGEGVLAMLQSSQSPPVETTLAALLNEIAIIPDSIVLVLDDYHLVDALPVDNALTFLLSIACSHIKSGTVAQIVSDICRGIYKFLFSAFFPNHIIIGIISI